MPNCNVRFGSKPEKLNESKCFPLFTQQRTSPRYLLSLRKSAITLSSGTSLPSSHMTSKFRPASRSSRRLDCTRKASEEPRGVGRPACRCRLDAFEAEIGQIGRVDKGINHTNGIALL